MHFKGLGIAHLALGKMPIWATSPQQRVDVQVASMAGSALAGRLLAPALNVRVERYMQAVFAVSAVALFVPVIFNRTKAPDETDSMKVDAPGERLWE